MLGRILRYYLKQRLSPRVIKTYIQTKARPEQPYILEHRSLDDCAGPEDRIVRLSCVQREIKLVRGIESYIDLMEDFVHTAAKEGYQLVAFPEYNVFDLLGLIPGVKALNGYLNKINQKKPAERLEQNQTKGLGERVIHQLFKDIAPPTGQALLAIMTELARKYSITIYSGSYLTVEDGKLFNIGTLIDHRGDIIGHQKKLHLTDFEEAIGFSRGDELNVFQLDYAKLAMPICMDASYFETFSLAEQLGAEIVVVPIANMEEYNQYKSMRGIWARVQESGLCGVKASLNGWLAGMHFTGKAGLFAPIDYTASRDGIINIASRHEGDRLIGAEVNLSKLERIKASSYLGDRNLEFETAYFQNTYEGRAL